jgi:predicted SAM-dependent methyltransferase
MKKVELGGGNKPEKGFYNIDIVPGDFVDKVIDLGVDPLPFESETIEELRSVHCLEHVENVFWTLNEICRVCKIGASVLIVVPHHNQDMAMCPGHCHVIGETMIDHFKEFPKDIWTGDKYLNLIRKAYSPTKYFKEARSIPTFRDMSDNQIYRFVPNTCHDVSFYFTVDILNV